MLCPLHSGATLPTERAAVAGGPSLLPSSEAPRRLAGQPRGKTKAFFCALSRERVVEW